MGRVRGLALKIEMGGESVDSSQTVLGNEERIIITNDAPVACGNCAHLQQQVSELSSRLEQATEACDRALIHLQEKTSLEKSLREKTQALVRSNRDLDQFASVAAHDLQEPLHSILVFLDLLQVKYGTRLDDEGLGYVKRVRSAADRMQQQIQGLLVYSKLGNQISCGELVALSPLCEDIVSDLRGRIEEVGGHVLIGDLPAIQGEPTHFRQLFQNLIHNALKFHQPGQSPVVRISGTLMPDRRLRGSDKARQLCRVDIADEGIGIPPDCQQKIFGMFQRLHRHDEYEGVGIGLAVCQRIVEYYGGRVSVQSDPGKGSTFTVTLPEKWEGPCS